MNPADILRLFDKHFAPRARRVWIGAGRAHVELRSADSQELTVVATELEREVQRTPELLWAEVHQATSRAVLAFHPGALDETAAAALVTEVELRAGLANAVFSDHDYVADSEPGERLLLELCADGLGLLFGAGLKLTFLPRSRLAGAVASALSVVRAVPRLRRPLDERFGAERSDLALSLLFSALQAPAQRPLNALVGLLEKLNTASELASSKKLWERREPALCSAQGALPPRPVPDRPVALPRGPIEEYSDRAWAVALAGFGVSFLSTRSVQRAFGALFGGVPRPAKLGREVFAAGLSRLLAARQMLVLDREALRRLDRVDCLVLQGSLIPGGVASLGRLIFPDGVDQTEARSLVEELFAPEEPLAIRNRGPYRLRPLQSESSDVPPALAERARSMAEAGELVLAFEKDGAIAALVEVKIRSQVGMEELIQAAHDASMRVVVASEDPEILQSIPADDTLGDGEQLWRGVRQLQRDGRVVAVVSQGDSRALDVADLGIALVPENSPVPWSADILCRNDLTDVRLLIESCQEARAVSRQSVNIALGAASVGALVSVGGLLPMTTSRVFTVVNLASLVSMANGGRLSNDFSRRPLPPARDPTPWHALDARGVMTRLGTSMDGLPRKEALTRARTFQPKKSALVELSSAIGDELFNPLVPLLAAGAGLSAVAGSIADAMMVGGVVGLNAAVGGVQRFRTERAIDDLARSAKLSVLVRRQGVTEQVASDSLVRGDVVLLSSGDLVPADCRLVEARGLEVDASGLTGESLPVAKDVAPCFEESIADRSSMLYAGTSIASGHATAVVVATGAETEARRGAASFRVTERESGVERRMRELMDLTGPVALLAGAGVVAGGLLRGRKLDQLVGSAVSLAVASVPEGLPLLATGAQLAAARRLRKHGALVRNARALEALGRVDTVCFDKTGTVTEGAIDLALVSDGQQSDPVDDLSAQRRDVLAAAMRASPPRAGDPARSDPVDAAVWKAADLCRVAVHRGLDVEHELAGQGSRWRRHADVPFEAARSYYAVLGQAGEQRILSVKGAPEALLDRCDRRRLRGEVTTLGDDERRELAYAAQELARSGLRVLSVAEREFPDDRELSPEAVDGLVFAGFLAFRDPIRPTARRALMDLRRAGLKPLMITGDHPSTGRAIAVELGLSDDPVVLTGAELASLDEDELAERSRYVDVYARVSPSQKVRIVRGLGKTGRTVAMVGDGANDAAAIRLASVGVAMGEHCAEAARNAADIVLIDARIETLVRAIVEGRAVWDAVRDAVSILVGGNLGEIGFTLVGGLVAGRPPLSPRQLLLVNLFTDVAPAAVLALRAPKEHELEELASIGPEDSMGWQLDRDIGARALVTASGAGLAWSVATLIGDRRGASTTALLALVGTQLGQTWSSGERDLQVAITSALSALGLAMIVQTPGVSGAFGCRPLGPIGWAIAAGASSAATAGGKYAPDFVERFFRDRGLAPELTIEGLEDNVASGRAPAQISAEMVDIDVDL